MEANSLAMRASMSGRVALEEEGGPSSSLCELRMQIPMPFEDDEILEVDRRLMTFLNVFASLLFFGADLGFRVSIFEKWRERERKQRQCKQSDCCCVKVGLTNWSDLGIKYFVFNLINDNLLCNYVNAREKRSFRETCC